MASQLVTENDVCGGLPTNEHYGKENKVNKPVTCMRQRRKADFSDVLANLLGRLWTQSCNFQNADGKRLAP